MKLKRVTRTFVMEGPADLVTDAMKRSYFRAEGQSMMLGPFENGRQKLEEMIVEVKDTDYDDVWTLEKPTP